MQITSQRSAFRCKANRYYKSFRTDDHQLHENGTTKEREGVCPGKALHPLP